MENLTVKKENQFTHFYRDLSENLSTINHVKTYAGAQIYHFPIDGKSVIPSTSQSTPHIKSPKTHSEDRPYKCDHCAKTFTKNSNLTQHLKIHTGEKPYQCNYCEKSFLKNSNLKQHIRIHTGEKPFKCSQCGKGFTRNSYLTSHLKTHTWEKPKQSTPVTQHPKHEEVPVPVPVKSTDILSLLNIHTEEKTHQYSHLAKASIHKNHYGKYPRAHSEEKPHQYNYFDRTFSSNSNLT